MGQEPNVARLPEAASFGLFLQELGPAHMAKTDGFRFCGTATLGVMLALGGSTGVRAGSLVANGNFTISSGGPLTAQQVVGTTPLADWFTPTNPSSSFTFLFLNSTAAGSGPLNSGVPLYGPASQYALPDSSNFVGMDGTAQVGPLSQTIGGLVSGDQYAVSFKWAGAQQMGFDGGVSCAGTSNPTATNCTTDQWDVFLGTVPSIVNNQPATYTTGQELSTNVITVPNNGFVTWMSQTLTFTASAASETLSFVAQGSPNGAPPFALLADVSMTQVPEPATVAILLTGIAGLGLAGLRRRKR